MRLAIDLAAELSAEGAASIIALGGLLDLRVVAEGVEMRAQSDFLLAHGCHQQQGYLFARPMPADELMRRRLTLAGVRARHLLPGHRGLRVPAPCGAATI